MPTYRYRCEGCGEEFELWQSITDDALATHDASMVEGGCGGHVVKVLTPAGIVLKGSGFYKTDNRGSRSSTSGNGDGSKSSDSSSKSSDSKSDSSSSSGSGSGSGSGSKDSSSSSGGSKRASTSSSSSSSS